MKHEIFTQLIRWQVAVWELENEYIYLATLRVTMLFIFFLWVHYIRNQKGFFNDQRFCTGKIKIKWNSTYLTIYKLIAQRS